MDNEDLYDEFGNYIGPDPDDDEDEEVVQGVGVSLRARARALLRVHASEREPLRHGADGGVLHAARKRPRTRTCARTLLG